jgi:hypothetical protein
MLTHEEFQQAIRLDFTDLSEDGTEFERLVQELLQAMGFRAEHTGIGPDYGVDVVAEEILLDRLGAKQIRRYVVQCKHFAHGKRVVGLSHVSDIIDTIHHYRANGYLLVTSTDITSSLKQKLSKLSEAHPDFIIHVWDHNVLEQRLNSFPVLVAKYFPSRFRQIKIAIPEPKGSKETFVRDRILAHQQEFVGSKFIPKLYVRRYIEESLQASLQSPIDTFQTLKSQYSAAIESYLSEINNLTEFPQFFTPPMDESSTLSWTTDMNSLRKRLKKAEMSLSSYKWNPVSDYIKGGTHGVESGFNALTDVLKNYLRSVETLLSPFYLCVQEIELIEEGVKKFASDYRNRMRKSIERPIRDAAFNEYKKKFKRLKSQMSVHEFDEFVETKVKERLSSREVQSRIKRELRGLPPPKIDLEQRYKWRRSEFLRIHNLEIRREKQEENTATFSSFKQSLEELSKKLRNSPLSYFKEVLEGVLNCMHIVVDIAGSGKTNLCCRLALQEVNKAFVVFLTGKSLGKEFSNIIKYLEDEIKSVLQPSGSADLKSLSQELQRMNYPLVIIFDGINENSNPSKMRANLKDLFEFVMTAPVRAVITSRTEYWNYYSDLFTYDDFAAIISGKLAKFTEDEHAIAIPVYLDHYKLDVRLESKAWEQLKRPLILRFFCEAYGDSQKRSYRHIPPLKEVRLFRLFGEYCRVKYSNICSKLNEEGYHVDQQRVEELAYLIAESCLKRKTRALKAVPLLKTLTKHSASALQVYRSLLDEDIVIEETVELRNSELERFVSFVYEAFMEYLMARVLLYKGANDDSKLYRLVNQLLENEHEFVHVRGILAFLMPYCSGKYPKTYNLILLQLKRPEYAENCVPVLLNLWDSDWQSGIWPVLQVVVDNLLLIPVEQVVTFVKDWLGEHRPEGFLQSIQQNPRAIISILDRHIVQIIMSLETDQREEILEALLSLLGSADSHSVAEEIIYAVRRIPWCSKNTKINGEPLFLRLIRASLPILSSNRNASRDKRDWVVLDLLGKLGEQWVIKKEEIPQLDNLKVVVGMAIFDKLYIKKRINEERLWWGDMLGLNVEAIELEVEEWVLDPVYTEREFMTVEEFVDYGIENNISGTLEFKEAESSTNHLINIDEDEDWQ